MYVDAIERQHQSHDNCLQVFLDHLAVHKGKDDKKKRTASKSRERGASQTAASSPAQTPNTTGMFLDDPDVMDGMGWEDPGAEQSAL